MITLLLGMALGAAALVGLQAWFDRPVRRPAPKPIGAQWTPEAAESLVRGWSK